jgi:hypothetical protein
MIEPFALSRDRMVSYRCILVSILTVLAILQLGEVHGSAIASSTGRGWLSAKNNKIVDAYGSVFQPRGASVMELSYQGQFYAVDTPNLLVPKLASYGANMIRLAINSYFWINGSQYFTATKYQSTADSFILAAQDYGLYVAIDLHNTLQQPQNYNDAQVYADIKDPTGMGIFWQSVASHYADQSNVVYSFLGQPIKSSGYLTAANKQLWRDVALSEARLIHAINSKALLFIPALDCCSLEQFINSQLPEPNIVYALHRYYHFDIGGAAYANAYAAGASFTLAYQYMKNFYATIMFQLRGKGYPVILVEFGATTPDPNWDRQITDLYKLLRNNGVGFLQWVWYQDALFSLYQSDQTLSPQGQLWAKACQY